MKTARELVDEWDESISDFDVVEAIEARDAEHLAESKAREEALRAERDRLKGELAAVRWDRECLTKRRDELESELAELHEKIAADYEPKDGFIRACNRLAELEGELAEARKELLYVADCETVTPDCHRRILALLNPAAPSPAESTGVKPMGIMEARIEDQKGWENTAPKPAAPPDDIREELTALDRKVEMVRLDAARYTTLERWVELRLSQFQSELNALKNPSAAPQEQAGHDPPRCQQCGALKTSGHGHNTGAKP